MSSRRVLITGGTSGIGLGTAKALRDMGWDVTVMGRRTTSEAGITHIPVDFGDLGSVVSTRHQLNGRFDRVVLNAGIGTLVPGNGCRVCSKDGIELRFQINYLSHFALICRPGDGGLAETASRVVAVISDRIALPDLKDLCVTKEYSGLTAYARSKGALAALISDITEGNHGGEMGRGACVDPGAYVPTGLDRAGRPKVTPLELAVHRVVAATVKDRNPGLAGAGALGADDAFRHKLRVASAEIIRRVVE